MKLSTEIIVALGLILAVVCLGNLGLQAKIATDETKYFCPEVAAAVNGVVDVKRVNRLHEAYSRISEEVFGYG